MTKNEIRKNVYKYHKAINNHSEPRSPQDIRFIKKEAKLFLMEWAPDTLASIGRCFENLKQVHDIIINTPKPPKTHKKVKKHLEKSTFIENFKIYDNDWLYFNIDERYKIPYETLKFDETIQGIKIINKRIKIDKVSKNWDFKICLGIYTPEDALCKITAKIVKGLKYGELLAQEEREIEIERAKMDLENYFERLRKIVMKKEE